MDDDSLYLWSTASGAVRCQDLVIRETSTTRIVFRVLLVPNRTDPDASLHAAFLLQRKSVNDYWVDSKEVSLKSLKKAEGLYLDLHAAEVLAVFKHLHELYAFHKKEGLPWGVTELVRAEGQVRAFLELAEQELHTFFDQNPTDGHETLLKVIRWASRLENVGSVTDKLGELELTGLEQIHSLAGLTYLKNTLAIWDDNAGNSDEEFWQVLLGQRSIVLSQLLAHPVVVINDKAYVGGKSTANTGGNIVDFLLQNELTHNAVLVEIKTPVTRLLGKVYRQNAICPSDDLSGAVVQVLTYKASLLHEYESLSAKSDKRFEAFEPQCLVVIGNLRNEVRSERQRRSFELYRNSISGVQIVTYDELFAKIRHLADVLQAGLNTNQEAENDESALEYVDGVDDA